MTLVHSPERLYYHGTHTEVRLGDRISIVTLFLKRERYGFVACIPDRTGRERAAIGKDPEDWLIKMDNGTFTGWIYSPEDLQPPKRLKFVSRGSPDLRETTNDELEELERREEENVSWGELFLLATVKLAILAGVTYLLWKLVGG